MFLQVSVILSTGGGGGWVSGRENMIGRENPPPAGRSPPGKENPPGIRSMSGRYASYWIAFLFYLG